jgi:hypothetical protein
MTDTGSRASGGRAAYSWLVVLPAVVAVVAMVIAMQSTAGAAVEPVGLGTAGNYAVLGGTDVTNTGPSEISGGDLGVSPGTSVIGFTASNFTPPAEEDLPDSAQAQADLTTAYTQAMNETPATAITGGAISGPTVLTPGIYNASSQLLVDGRVTLNGENLANPVFVFQVGSMLTVGSLRATNFVLENGASACEVFWQVGSSATLDGGSDFVGSILASASISVLSSDTVDGRLLASTGGVTLIDDAINAPTGCAPTSTSSASASPTATPSSPSPTPTPSSTSPTPFPTSTSPTPFPTSTSPTPFPTSTSPVPSPSSTSPVPSPTSTSPSPSPTGVRHHHKHHHKRPTPAPVPTPVPTTVPVTG